MDLKGVVSRKCDPQGDVGVKCESTIQGERKKGDTRKGTGCVLGRPAHHVVRWVGVGQGREGEGIGGDGERHREG